MDSERRDSGIEDKETMEDTEEGIQAPKKKKKKKKKKRGNEGGQATGSGSPERMDYEESKDNSSPREHLADEGSVDVNSDWQTQDNKKKKGNKSDNSLKESELMDIDTNERKCSENKDEGEEGKEEDMQSTKKKKKKKKKKQNEQAENQKTETSRADVMGCDDKKEQIDAINNETNIENEDISTLPTEDVNTVGESIDDITLEDKQSTLSPGEKFENERSLDVKEKEDSEWETQKSKKRKDDKKIVQQKEIKGESVVQEANQLEVKNQQARDLKPEEQKTKKRKSDEFTQSMKEDNNANMTTDMTTGMSGGSGKSMNKNFKRRQKKRAQAAANQDVKMECDQVTEEKNDKSTGGSVDGQKGRSKIYDDKSHQKQQHKETEQSRSEYGRERRDSAKEGEHHRRGDNRDAGAQEYHGGKYSRQDQSGRRYDSERNDSRRDHGRGGRWEGRGEERERGGRWEGRGEGRERGQRQGEEYNDSRWLAERGGNYHQRPRRSREDHDDVWMSKNLSYLLRHGAVEQKLQFQEGGFLYVDDILKRKKFEYFTVEDVQRIVQNDNKQRYTIKEGEGGKLMIRANQGHTLQVDVEMTPITNPDEFPNVVHGTYYENWEYIKDTGLNRMGRQHIHFAIGLPGQRGVISGMRNTSEILIFMDMAKALNDGFKFFRSANNVILSPGNDEGGIPVKYFSKVLDYETKKSLI